MDVDTFFNRIRKELIIEDKERQQAAKLKLLK